MLSSRDRKRFAIVTGLQMSTSFLDLLGVLLLGVVVALATSVQSGSPPPASVSKLIDALSLNGTAVTSLAGVLAVIAGVVLIAKSGLNTYMSRRILRFLANRQAWVSGSLAARTFAQPLVFMQAHSSQALSFALTHGVNAATIMVLGSTAIILSETALLVVLAIGLLFLDPFVTIATVLYFGLLAVGLQKVMSAWATDIGRATSMAEIDSVVTVQEVVRSYREIAVAQRRNMFVDRFAGLRQRAAVNQADLTFLGALPKYVFEIALVVGAALLAVSQFLTKDLSSALATITVVFVAATRIIPSLLRLQQGLVSIRWASGTAESTFALITELEVAERGGLSRPEPRLRTEEFGASLMSDHPGFGGAVVLDRVSFTYPKVEAAAVSDVSMSVRPGGSLAIVGSTGAGKSTLTDLILGLLEPEEGTVAIDGMAPAAAMSAWPGAVAYVPQEVAMVNGSVRQNVALGMPDDAIDEQRVLEALTRARLSDFLSLQRDGLETLIGEDGVMLSGGQRQRLGIARALYTRPRLLIMDEATSALDAETERDVIETLKELSGTVTTITIAHRLATVQHCDQVAYLDAGRLEAVGTFEEVRSLVPRFDEQARLLGL